MRPLPVGPLRQRRFRVQGQLSALLTAGPAAAGSAGIAGEFRQIAASHHRLRTKTPTNDLDKQHKYSLTQGPACRDRQASIPAPPTAKAAQLHAFTLRPPPAPPPAIPSCPIAASPVLPRCRLATACRLFRGGAAGRSRKHRGSCKGPGPPGPAPCSSGP